MVILATGRLGERATGRKCDGETGILVEPDRPDELAQAILALAGDEALRRRMGRAGRRRVEEQFTWNAVARRALQAMREAGLLNA